MWPLASSGWPSSVQLSLLLACAISDIKRPCLAGNRPQRASHGLARSSSPVLSDMSTSAPRPERGAVESAQTASGFGAGNLLFCGETGKMSLLIGSAS